MNDNLPGVEIDDPNLPDEDQAEAAAQKVLLQEVLGEEYEPDPEEAEEEAEGEPQPGGQSAPAGTPQNDPASPPDEPRFSQADIERIIGERLGRDRKVQAVRQLESIAGQPLEQLVQGYRERQVEQAQEQFAMTEDEARAYVFQQEELRALKSQQEAIRQQQEAMQHMMAYQQEKQRHLTATPLARKYEREIDEFSGMGTHLPYDAAMAYILGQKVLSGEVLQNVQRAAQAKTLADVQKRRAAAPEAATAGGGPANASLTPQERLVANRLGLTAKEYQESKKTARARRG